VVTSRSYVGEEKLHKARREIVNNPELSRVTAADEEPNVQQVSTLRTSGKSATLSTTASKKRSIAVPGGTPTGIKWTPAEEEAQQTERKMRTLTVVPEDLANISFSHEPC
jgi:hypothetical protein